MIVEFLLLVLIAVAVFAYVLAPIVWSGRKQRAGEQAEDVSSEDGIPTETIGTIDQTMTPERQPEQKQPVRDAP